MIYLFCNERYGRAFIEMARRCRVEDGQEITLVFSDRRPDGAGASLIARSRRALGKRAAERRGGRAYELPVVLAENVNREAFLSAVGPGAHGIVAGFNQIFKRRAISRFETLVNFHPSLLPYYRGPVPSHWCIENGETRTGFTLHHITAKIDEGEILHQQVVEIGDLREPDLLDRRIAERAAVVFRAYLASLAGGRCLPRTSVDARSVYVQHPDYLSFPVPE